MMLPLLVALGEMVFSLVELVGRWQLPLTLLNGAQAVAVGDYLLRVAMVLRQHQLMEYPVVQEV
jgi:hypothetical protein